MWTAKFGSLVFNGETRSFMKIKNKKKFILSNEKSPKKPLSSVLLLLVIQNILSKSDEKFYELFFFCD